MQRRSESFEGRAWLSVGRALSALASLFLLFDGFMKLVKPAPVIRATAELGFPETEIVGIGITLLICTSLYVIPRASTMGAVLLTGYLGGAIASKVRIHAPLFDISFALILAAFVWGGLWLRNPRLRTILPC